MVDLSSNGTDNCLDREYAHYAYNCTRRSRRPTPNDDEQFRTGWSARVKLRVGNTKLSMNAMNLLMNAKSERMNAKRTHINDQSYTYLKYKNTKFITNGLYSMHCAEKYLETEYRILKLLKYRTQ